MGSMSTLNPIYLQVLLRFNLYFCYVVSAVLETKG